MGNEALKQLEKLSIMVTLGPEINGCIREVAPLKALCHDIIGDCFYIRPHIRRTVDKPRVIWRTYQTHAD